MIFTSDVYVVFLIATVLLHWLLPASFRKTFIILASYVFYATWNWHYLFLLIGVSLFNWAYALFVVTRFKARGILLLGVLANVCVLGFFKYTNFLIDNASVITGWVGGSWTLRALQITLPLGISFFTFQGIAYLVDIASGEKPLHRLSDFLLFKALWPQLIAGPIVRISEMREQLAARRILTGSAALAGARRIIMGFSKKLVLADTLAMTVDKVYAPGATASTMDVALGTIGFGLQIYFDFSAYSDIAIGSAALLGFVFPENFNWPYGAASPVEFWNRWHMTLSRWIRDYVFTPLSFTFRRRVGMETLCLVGAMGLCGLWHGAKWTFVIWGLWHGMLLALNSTFLKGWSGRAEATSRAGRGLRVVITYGLVNLGWILFRSETMGQALGMYGTLATLRGGPGLRVVTGLECLFVLSVLGGLFVADSLQAPLGRAWATLVQGREWLQPLRLVADVALVHLAIIFGASPKPFVYFQF